MGCSRMHFSAKVSQKRHSSSAGTLTREVDKNLGADIDTGLVGQRLLQGWRFRYTLPALKHKRRGSHLTKKPFNSIAHYITSQIPLGA